MAEANIHTGMETATSRTVILITKGPPHHKQEGKVPK